MLSPYFFIVGQEPRVAGAQSEKIAILGLEVRGVVDLESVRVANELTAALRSRAANGPYVIAPNSARELIDEKLMHNCEDERKECMAKIGRSLNADYLLYGRIEKTSRGGVVGYQISLQLLKVNNLYLTTWTEFITGTDAAGTLLTSRGNSGYAHLISLSSQQNRRAVGDGDKVLVHATNEAFWQLTRYKPGQKLNMADPQDRSMSKTWLDLYQQIRGRRARATELARRVLNETLTPYILIIEQQNGSLTHRTFERRGNLDVQYSWLLDQPEYYTYLAMFDFTRSRDALILDQFAISKRRQLAASGW